MKIKSVKTLTLSEEELRRAVVMLLQSTTPYCGSTHSRLATHLKNNVFSANFNSNGELEIHMDGYFDDGVLDG